MYSMTDFIYNNRFYRPCLYFHLEAAPQPGQYVLITYMGYSNIQVWKKEMNLSHSQGLILRLMSNGFGAGLNNGMNCIFSKYADIIKLGKLAETLWIWTNLTYWLTSSLAEKDLSVPVDKTNIIQQCVLAQMKNNCMWGYVRKSVASRPKWFFTVWY